MKSLIRLLSLSLLFLFLATSCELLDEFLGNGEDLRVNNLVANYQDGAVQLSWEYVDGADGYDIWFYSEFNGNYQHIDTVYGSTSYTHHFEFQSDTYYYYMIRIKDSNGNWGEYSDPASVYIDYVNGNFMVNNLEADFYNGAVQLSWEYIDGADGYDIWFYSEYDGNYQHIDTVYGGTSYTHNFSFQSDTYYYYIIRVKDYNGNWYDYSDPVSVYIDYVNGGGNGVVENLYVEMQGGDAHITWNQHYDAQEYELEYKIGEYGNYMYLATLDQWSTSYHHYSLNVSTYYYYRIRFRDFNGNWSNYSEEVWVYSGDDYGGNTVTNFNVYMSGSSAYIYWDYHYDAQQYEIEFSYNEYEYMYLTTIYDGYATEYYHDNLESNTYYYYRIRYMDYNGYWSDYSNTISVYTGEIGGNTVTNLYAEMYGSSSYISWDEHYNADEYQLEYSFNQNDSYMLLATLGTYTTEFFHDNLEPGTTYYYRVRYRDAYYEWSEYTYPVSVYSGDLIGEGVTGFEAYSDGGNIYLSWNSHYDADYYEIWASDVYDGEYYPLGSTSDIMFVDDTIPANTDRYYKVRLVDYYGDPGAYSVILYGYVEILLSDNNNLSSLTFSTGTLDSPFDNGDYHYILTVGSDVEILTIVPTLEDNTATLYINDAEFNSGETSGPESLVMGNNDSVFVIDVYAENGTVRTFQIDVFREPTADLTDFFVHGAVNVHYDEVEDNYYVGTETGVGSVDIEVIALDPTAIIRIDGVTTDYRTINLSGDYNERTFVVEIDPNNGLGDSRFINVFITPNWTNDNPGGESVLYYSFSTTQFDEYTIQWDDKVNGSGLYGEDILVTALYGDMSTVYGGLDRVNSGFYNPVTLTAQEDGVIILKVEAVDGGILEDDFALRVFNETYGNWEEFLVSGDNTIVIE